MNPELEFYRAHSPFTDPARFASLLETLPSDVPGLCAALRGLVVHYVGSGLKFSPERLEEIDARRVEQILSKLWARAETPLNVARDADGCFVGCCRDFATLFVAAMRQRGVPARTRIGFAPYIKVFPDFSFDHVVAEYWNGARWVMVDPQFAPGFADFDIQDMPDGAFLTASSAWRGYRAGRLDPMQYGVAPHLPYRGPWFLRNYVMLELAALNSLETLLWDGWGEMSLEDVGDAALMDRASEVMLGGDWEAIRALYTATPALQVTPEVMCFSPTGNVRAERLPLI